MNNEDGVEADSQIKDNPKVNTTSPPCQFLEVNSRYKKQASNNNEAAAGAAEEEKSYYSERFRPNFNSIQAPNNNISKNSNIAASNSAGEEQKNLN